METEEGMWQDVLKEKYRKNECLALVEKKPGDSQFWTSLLKIKNI